MPKLIVNSLGCGFINLADKTIFIPKKKINGAMNGDIVEYLIENEENNVASITNIIQTVPDYGFVSHIYQGDYVIKTDRKQYYFSMGSSDLEINDFVKINNNQILINFGNKDDFNNKIKYIKEKYQVNSSSYQKADGTNLTEEDFEETKRVDLTGLYTFTIDPTSSKDFDDAISISREEHGFTLGVHIADVSHYIKPNSALDIFAKQKMNTVYLNGDTTHMLPSELSNNLCSLVPNELRNAVTVMTDFDKQGNIIRYSIFRSKILSKKRYTYQEVRDQIENQVMDTNIENLYQFIKNKFPGIDTQYNLPMYNIQLDNQKSPINVEIESYDMSHLMIEKCMILANEIVAEDLSNKGALFPYRCHPEPSQEQEEKYLKQKNYSDNNFYQEIIKIKSFKNAYYSHDNISHFGLDSKKYCHFTSPIRRYTDIIVHRVLLNECTYSKDELDEICQQANELEGNAFKAELELLEMQKDFLIEKDNSQQPLLVIDVTKYGITVELLNYYTERKIHISKLSDKRLTFDYNTKRLFNDKDSYSIGQIVNLKIN